jgi:uncharacterized Ntn-hydrolase superfamily protein
VNPELFARFLELLASDTEEAGRRYTCLHKKLIGFFRMKGISDPENAADETIDRAVLKIGAGAVVPDVDKYCLGIARNVAKERYRFMQRENSVLHKLIGELSHSSVEQVERIYSILKPCFEQLATEEQQLLLAYCHEIKGRARAKYRGKLAETMKISVLALRIRVTRLRSSLTDCVQKQSNKVL